MKGLWTCPTCGKPLTAGVIKKKYRKYACHRCPRPQPWLDESRADEAITEELRSMRVSPSDAQKAISYLSKPDAAAQAREAQVRALCQREADLTRKLDGLIDMRAAQEIDAETFRRRKADIDRDLAGVREQLAAAYGSGPVRVDTLVKVFELLEKVGELYVVAEPAAKRRILDLVFLNSQADGVSLRTQKRRPFDLLTERPLISSGRGGEI